MFHPCSIFWSTNIKIFELVLFKTTNSSVTYSVFEVQQQSSAPF